MKYSSVNERLDKRPVTQGIINSARQSINEEFNKKLIEHGPSNGVPENELPNPRSSINSIKRGVFSLNRSMIKGGEEERPVTNYADRYQLKQKKLSSITPSRMNR